MKHTHILFTREDCKRFCEINRLRQGVDLIDYTRKIVEIVMDFIDYARMIVVIVVDLTDHSRMIVEIFAGFMYFMYKMYFTEDKNIY